MAPRTKIRVEVVDLDKVQKEEKELKTFEYRCQFCDEMLKSRFPVGSGRKVTYKTCRNLHYGRYVVYA